MRGLSLASSTTGSQESAPMPFACVCSLTRYEGSVICRTDLLATCASEPEKSTRHGTDLQWAVASPGALSMGRGLTGAQHLDVNTPLQVLVMGCS